MQQGRCQVRLCEGPVVQPRIYPDEGQQELAPTFDKILRENGIEAPMERVEAVVGMMKMKKINFIKELWPLCDFFFIAPEAYDPRGQVRAEELDGNGGGRHGRTGRIAGRPG